MTSDLAPATESREVGTDEQRTALRAALVAAAAEAPAVAKDGYNQHSKYRYASSEHVLVAARPVLTRHGLAVVPRDGRVKVLGDVTVPDGRDGTRTETLIVFEREFEVCHEGGGGMHCSSKWPFRLLGCSAKK